MNVDFELLSSFARAPAKSTTYSAGYDFFSCNDNIVLKPNTIYKLRTGVIVRWTDPNCRLELKGRSSYECLGIELKAGIIDYDYQKEVIVVLKNTSDEEFIINYGDKICQGLFYQSPMVMQYFTTVRQADGVITGEYFPHSSNVRTGGFGSTGR